jgi:hypothetical protein
MRRRLHAGLLVLGVAAALALNAGCDGTGGGNDGASSVAYVEGAPGSIDRVTLGHWMRALVGESVREDIGTQGPSGLVSEPADYSRCIDAAKLLAPRSFFNQLRLTRPQLERSCHQLYRSAKAQALGYLISVRWSMVEAIQRGLSVTDGEVYEAVKRLRKRIFPTEGDLRRYLAERQWSLSDLYYQTKAELLGAKLVFVPGQRVAFDGSFFARPIEHHLNLARRTTCEPAYVVPGCKEYQGPPVVTPTPKAIIRSIVQGTA